MRSMLTVMKDAADSDRRYASYYCAKDTRMGRRIRQAAGRGCSEIWDRELVARYSYLHFHDKLSLTKLGKLLERFLKTRR